MTGPPYQRTDRPRARGRGAAGEGRRMLDRMQITWLDWAIALASVLVCFIPALFLAKRSGANTSEFFGSGRSVPWWLAGLSMVATTFSSDTPNWVTEQV